MNIKHQSGPEPGVGLYMIIPKKVMHLDLVVKKLLFSLFQISLYIIYITLCGQSFSTMTRPSSVILLFFFLSFVFLPI